MKNTIIVNCDTLPLILFISEFPETEALEQILQGRWGCALPESVQGQVGWSSEQPGPVELLSQKWDHLPSVRYANIHTEQRYCLYCVFAEIWVLDDTSTKLAYHLAESQRLYTFTKPKKFRHYMNRSLLTSCFFGNSAAFSSFLAGYSPFISLLAALQGHNC